MRGQAQYVLVMSAALLASCVTDPDLEGRPCPCVEGYTCIADVCVSDANLPDADVDARADAGVFRSDAAMDSSTDDVPSTDAGADAADAAMDAAADVPADVFDGGPPATPFCDRHGGGAYACIDFESSFAPWRVIGRGDMSAVVIDPARGFNGSSLRVTSGFEGFAALERLDLPVVSSGRSWLRMRVYIEPEDADGLQYFSLVALTEFSTPPRRAAVGLAADGRLLGEFERDDMGLTARSGSTHPTGQWFCLEMEFDVAATSTLTVYLDGADVASEVIDGSAGWESVAVGCVGTSAADAVRDVWIDDFAWSPTRIPCDIE